MNASSPSTATLPAMKEIGMKLPPKSSIAGPGEEWSTW